MLSSVAQGHNLTSAEPGSVPLLHLVLLGQPLRLHLTSDLIPQIASSQTQTSALPHVNVGC